MSPPPASDSPSATRLARLRALGIAAPRPRIGFEWAAAPVDGLRRVLPLPRSRVAITVVAAIFAVMCIPLLAEGLPALRSLRAVHGLSDLGVALFRGFWLLGWATAAAVPGVVLTALLLGREVLTLRPGVLSLRVEVLGFGIGGDYPTAEVRNLRAAEGDTDTGTLWRGAHLVFDYHDVPVPFGSDLDPAAANELRFEISQVLARATGAAPQSATATPAFNAVDTLPDTTAPPAPLTTPAASRIALLGLVAANLLPLAGVLHFDWRVGDIMLVYWAESVIIGLINIVKLVVVGRWAAAFYAPFFAGHYGGFMSVHLIFIYTFFLHGMAQGGNPALVEVGTTLLNLWPALVGLGVSHALSFWQNFIGRREYTRTNVAAQMNAPYKRVVIMQLTIIFGGMLTLALGSSLPALLLMIAMKMAVDVNAHLGERRRAASATAAAS